MRPYSLDLRERVAAAVDHHEGSIRSIARVFRVSTSFVVRLLQRRRTTGMLDPEPHRGGPPRALGPEDLKRLAGLVLEQPDATLKQLQQRGGFTCSLKTLWYALDRLNLTYKKKSLHASQRDQPPVQKKRRSFRRKVHIIEAKQLVFVDETGITTAMTPTHARAPRGERAVDSSPASWETITVIAGLGLDGVRAPLAFPGATNTAVFQQYVEETLVPELHKGDVVVFDNLKPHLSVAVLNAIEKAGADVLPLPPYSPDYTPIEEMFSKVKQGLRRAEARTKTRLYDTLAGVFRQVTLQDILGWFQHAGLCATPR
ncbi:IS630 family transposase [Singulisphaera sp. Ch08]|uniref:IS630 family transposase n=1 Tax=Singulisphaera sp. Ch08 TaxID=3120278 RepID=A0AAU7C8X0_9BACT